jgi:hypothetical protein
LLLVYGITGRSLENPASIRLRPSPTKPTPEVAATGHQRTIIPIQEQYLSEWLSPSAVSKECLKYILSDKEQPYYVHQIAA